MGGREHICAIAHMLLHVALKQSKCDAHKTIEDEISIKIQHQITLHYNRKMIQIPSHRTIDIISLVTRGNNFNVETAHAEQDDEM